MRDFSGSKIFMGTLALILTAVSLAAAASVDEIVTLKGPDREKILIDGARKEGEMTWYTSLIVDQVSRPLSDAFQAKYPFIKVNLVRLETAAILQRLMAEQRASSVRVDVVAGDIAAPMKAAGLAQKFSTPYSTPYGAANVDPDGMWVSFRSSWQGIAWNTKMVADADAPKTWDNLLDPKWKGKMVWGSAPDTGAPRLFTHLRKVLGEDKALEFITKIQKQDVRTLPGSIRTVLDQVIAGEAPIGISMAMHHIAISKSLGAPVNGTSPEPVMTRTGVVTMARNLPHPHAGMLFVDYLLDKDGGAQVMVKAQYNSAHPEVDPLPELRWIQPSKNGKKEVILTPTEEEAMQPRSVEIYQKLFR